MSAGARRFLPDRLRPRVPRRRSQRRFILPVLGVMVVLIVLPRWTVRSVEVVGSDVVPESVSSALDDLVGHCVWLLDLEWAKQLAGGWPSAADVQVRLDLPGTLEVDIDPEPIRGSVAVGRGWHAVASDGRLAGSVTAPVEPRLEGLQRSSDRRVAFGVARRLTAASGGSVTRIRQVTPADYRVAIRFDELDHEAVVHVSPAGTEAERVWCELVNSDRLAAGWADLRWDHRMVLRTSPEHG
jgi:hypothetical protein